MNDEEIAPSGAPLTVAESLPLLSCISAAALGYTTISDQTVAHYRKRN
jgi:hypothetical protein